MRFILFAIQLFIMCFTITAHKEYKLQGTIGNIPIYMTLDDYTEDYPNGDRNLSGRYFYQSSLKDIVLSGGIRDNILTLEVESNVREFSETFTLNRIGNSFKGEWINNKGKRLAVLLEPIDVNSMNNPYSNIEYIAKLKTEDSYNYARSSFIQFNRDSVSVLNDRSIVWFSEKHSSAIFFRLGNGFKKNQLTAINPILDQIHLENVLNQLSCSFIWSYSDGDGDGIDYTISLDYLDDNLIGFEVFSSWFCGGAHPDFSGVGYLLDLNNGKSYDLKNIYDIKASIIYSLINEQEHFQKPKADGDCDYTELSCWENAQWAVAKDGVRFTPYFYRAARFCEEPFFISFSELKPYKKLDFPYNLK